MYDARGKRNPCHVTIRRDITIFFLVALTDAIAVIDLDSVIFGWSFTL
jgi:hypothetical protein